MSCGSPARVSAEPEAARPGPRGAGPDGPAPGRPARSWRRCVTAAGRRSTSASLRTAGWSTSRSWKAAGRSRVSPRRPERTDALHRDGEGGPRIPAARRGKGDRRPEGLSGIRRTRSWAGAPSRKSWNEFGGTAMRSATRSTRRVCGVLGLPSSTTAVCRGQPVSVSIPTVRLPLARMAAWGTAVRESADAVSAGPRLDSCRAASRGSRATDENRPTEGGRRPSGGCRRSPRFPGDADERYLFSGIASCPWTPPPRAPLRRMAPSVSATSGSRAGTSSGAT